ncbi:glycoside hydrolase family 28 protein [Tuberibacillus sp. Marseille-P3662]|uniref:glycoside hydrolase family 28 protein n=1 Tax=Tuberibacillus sp. Marseille-P3662 TaxID=1965358 RepID=UPI00111BD2FC|nr:glycoside hydrolase family 28 protein [Tuberibacillus sp. Marseille-P3662]
MRKFFLLAMMSTFILGAIGGFPNGTKAETAQGWEKVPKILDSIESPTFPDQDFLVTDYGAVGNGETESTEAFKKAIQAAHDAGGGRVIVPEGTFLTGAIHLKSNVNLHVTKDATIKFSQNPDDYLPVVKTRFEGVELYNYSPFIYTNGVKNVAITGQGILDGQGDNNHWWPWKGQEEHGWDEGEPSQGKDRDRLFEMAENGVPVKQRVFGKGHYLRPNMIQFYNSNNILVRGVTIRNSPMWHIHPVLSENITIDNVSIIGHGPNNDGIDPESSQDVLIKDAFFNNGDDNIAIKSGRNADGRRIDVPSENIIIQGNHMKDGHGAVVMGSEITGGARNIYARNNLMDSPNLERALRIKTNSVRGGVIENIYLKDNVVKSVNEAVIKVNFLYEEGDAGHYTPVVRNIEVKNLQSHGGEYALLLKGYKRSPVSNIRIINSTLNNVDKPASISNVENLMLDNVRINGQLVTDLLTPETAAKIIGKTLPDGSYLHQAKVELTAMDDVSGIDHIEYRIGDNSDWTTYTEAFLISNEGTTDIEYRAVDQAGNVEAIKTKTVTVKPANLDHLTNIIETGDIDPKGIRQSMQARLSNASHALSMGKETEGYKKLKKLTQFIGKQPAHHIPVQVKEELTKVLNYIMEYKTM